MQLTQPTQHMKCLMPLPSSFFWDDAGRLSSDVWPKYTLNQSPKVGDVVTARWEDGKYYPGIILAILLEGIQVKYYDGVTSLIDKEHVKIVDIDQYKSTWASKLSQFPKVQDKPFNKENCDPYEKRKPLHFLANIALVENKLTQKMVEGTWKPLQHGVSRNRTRHQGLSKQPRVNGLVPCGKMCGRFFSHAPAAIAHTKVCKFNTKRAKVEKTDFMLVESLVSQPTLTFSS